VPAGSVPFYGITGNLQWLAPSGIMYTSQGHVGDTSNVHVMAERKGLSVSEFVTLIQTAVKAAGRPLTLGEMYAGQAGAEDRSLDRVA
jgi:hypothetical protein